MDALLSMHGSDTHTWFAMQEVDRVVARVRGRDNEQHDALGPVLSFVNANMQVTLFTHFTLPAESCFTAVNQPTKLRYPVRDGVLACSFTEVLALMFAE